jgi:tRNA pseudouridine55 synthase
VGLDKRYVTEIRLGLRTSTGDGEGDVVEETPLPSRAEIAALTGELELPIPAASAVKIEGKRAYSLHRGGVAVEMPRRRSTVHDLRVRRYVPPLVELELHVSSGTYVRAIADALGGHCRWLRRTAVGPFHVDVANEELVLPPLAALVHVPERRLDEQEASRIRGGRTIPGGGKGPIALWTGDGNLVAVGVAKDGVIRPETVVG